MPKCAECGKQIVNDGPSAGLTQRQRTVLTFLVEFGDKHGYTPSYEQVREHFGWASKANFYRYVDQLEQRGYVRRTPYLAGSLQVIHRPN